MIKEFNTWTNNKVEYDYQWSDRMNIVDSK